jgi:hypothetical protein
MEKTGYSVFYFFLKWCEEVNKKKVKNTTYPVLFYCTSSAGYEVMVGVIKESCR